MSSIINDFCTCLTNSAADPAEYAANVDAIDFNMFTSAFEIGFVLRTQIDKVDTELWSQLVRKALDQYAFGDSGGVSYIHLLSCVRSTGHIEKIVKVFPEFTSSIVLELPRIEGHEGFDNMVDPILACGPIEDMAALEAMQKEGLGGTLVEALLKRLLKPSPRPEYVLKHSLTVDQINNSFFLHALWWIYYRDDDMDGIETSDLSAIQQHIVTSGSFFDHYEKMKLGTVKCIDKIPNMPATLRKIFDAHVFKLKLTSNDIHNTLVENGEEDVAKGFVRLFKDYPCAEIILSALLGPSNETNYDTQSLDTCGVFGCRMFSCECLENDPSETERGEMDGPEHFVKLAWFKGACENCSVCIESPENALRIPVLGGCWYGCICVKPDCFEKVYDAFIKMQDDGYTDYTLDDRATLMLAKLSVGVIRRE